MAQTKKTPPSNNKTSNKTPPRPSIPKDTPTQPTPPDTTAVWFVGCLLLMFAGLIGAIAWFGSDAGLFQLFRRFFGGLFGTGWALMPVFLFTAGVLLMPNQKNPVRPERLVWMLLIIIAFGALVHTLGCEAEVSFGDDFIAALWKLGSTGGQSAGGVLGGIIAVLLLSSVRKYLGALLLLIALFFLILKLFDGSARNVLAVLLDAWDCLSPLPLSDEEQAEVDRILEEERQLELARQAEIGLDADTAAASAPRTSAPQRHARRSVSDYLKKFGVVLSPEPEPEEAEPAAGESGTDDDYEPIFAKYQPAAEPAPRTAFDLAREALSKKTAAAPADESYPSDYNPIADTTSRADIDFERDELPEDAPVSVPVGKAAAGKAVSAAIAVPAAPQKKPVVLPVEDEDENEPPVGPQPAAPSVVPEGQTNDAPAEYVFPPLSLLNHEDDSEDSTDTEDGNAAHLQEVIHSFSVSADLIGSIHGPSITRYDFHLAQGVKLSKFTNLSNDIALNLGVSNVRIAPIEGEQSVVGVEVPNKVTRTVWLGNTIDSDTFRKASKKSRVSVALGKDIGGNVIVGNIAKMPHVLIAGTTGSGKSVCINSLILSLLFEAKPDEVKLIMVDPKMVELGIYNGLPHMLVPVVTEAKKAAGALQWAVVEMLKRYRLFSEAGVRDLKGYNEMLISNPEKAAALGPDHPDKPMPQIVIIIDELADLMMVASKEVEESICRVAQMGRAAGMHLVVATQRPSADVITGLMKANIPSRIAFAVSSGIESRIILDQQGAEKLIGQGDMLYSPIGLGKPIRIQGAFVTDEEREEVINFIKAQCQADYSDEVLHQVEIAAAGIGEKKGKKGADDDFGDSSAPMAGGGNPFDGLDDLLPDAAEIIFETGQGSTSMVQRKLKVGYARASRLIDQLEQVGMLGPFNGSKPRDILITRDQWHEMQYGHGTAPVDKNTMQFADTVDAFGDDDSFPDDDDDDTFIGGDD